MFITPLLRDVNVIAVYFQSGGGRKNLFCKREHGSEGRASLSKRFVEFLTKIINSFVFRVLEIEP